LAPCTISPNARRGLARTLLFLPALAMLCAGCEWETKAEAPQTRSVRTVTRAQPTGGVDRPNSARERGGDRFSYRRADHRKIGRRWRPCRTQVLAKLDPQNELNALRSARAALSAAQGKLVQARNTFQRRETLLARGFTTKVLFDQAQQGLRTAQAQVDDAGAGDPVGSP
jgi:membrane fusion protein, multidrug efflux system